MKDNCSCKKKICPRQSNGEKREISACENSACEGTACGNFAFKSVLLIVICLTLIQCLLLGIKLLIFNYIAETLYSRSMVTMISMIVLIALTVLYCRSKGYCFSLFPKTFSLSYTVLTLIVAVFYLLTLFVVNTFTVRAALMLFYGSIVTPIFEELLFRGAVWNILNKRFSKEWETYLTVTLLFALWHIGYAVGIYLWNGGSLLSCIAMKVTVGALFGLLIGAVRWRTKNCYCGILIHGLLNALG